MARPKRVCGVCVGGNCLRCRNNRATAKYRENNAYKVTDTALRRKSGWSLKERREALEEQDFKCATCSKPIEEMRFTRGETSPAHADHDHKTMKPRGMLCARCNWVVGCFEGDPEVLNKIQAYLEYHKIWKAS